MLHYLLICLAGLAGSMHCIGMCGGFVCVMGRDPRGAGATVSRHLVYNLGRVSTYCFLGAAVGAFGALLVGHHGEATAATATQRALAVASGVLMLYIGLQFLGAIRSRDWRTPAFGIDFLASALRQLVKAPGAGAPLALGALNGFLPCPLVYAFLAQAAASGGPQSGMLTMAAFGLGTFPAMLAMGALGTWLRPVPAGAGQASMLVRSDWRHYSLRLAGGFIVLLAAITIARGVLPMGVHLH